MLWKENMHTFPLSGDFYTHGLSLELGELHTLTVGLSAKGDLDLAGS